MIGEEALAAEARRRDGEGALPDGAQLRVTIAYGLRDQVRGRGANRGRGQVELDLPASDPAIREALSRGPAPYIVRVRSAALGPNMSLAASRAGDVWRLNALAKQLELSAPSASSVAEATLSLIRRPPTIEDAMSAMERADGAEVDLASRAPCPICRQVPPPIPFEELQRRIGARHDEARLGRARGEEPAAASSRQEARARDDAAARDNDARPVARSRD